MPRQHLARRLQKFNETRSVLDSACDGRPLEFSDEAKDLILEIALERQKEQKRCSAKFIRAKIVQLKKVWGVKFPLFQQSLG